MRYATVCSGIEAPSAAWHPLGWLPVFFSEIEKFPSAVLAHHYPDVPNLGDMTRIDGAAWRGKVDVLIGGTPCQAFSVAGKRDSLADDRGNLSLTFCELVHAIDPLCVVWENVPGVLSVKDNAFGCFLAGLVGEGSGPFISRNGSWPVAGVVVGPRRSACWRVLDAQYHGLAQRRRRVFVVSFRTGDGINPAAVLLEPESVPRHSAPSREAGTRVTQALTRRLGASGPDDNRAQANHLIAATLQANYADKWGLDNQHVDQGCPNFVTHPLRADGFDASEDGTGRGVPLVPVAFSSTESHGSGNNINISPTLKIGSDGGGAPPAIAYRTSGNCGVMEQGDRTASLGTHTDPSEQIIQNAYGVRRLLPVECERLMGFPDRYTDIPGAKDGPRYKALGNSMAVPVIRWIGERIEKVLKAHRTRLAGAA